MAYYVFDDARNQFEGMTREEIVNAIASATGVDPSVIDSDVITSAIKEKKAQQNVSLWVGTQNEYNAIATPDENTLYIVTDPHETNELQAQIDQLESQINQMVINGLQIETQTASVTPDGSNILEHTFTLQENFTILEVAYKPNEIIGAAWIHEGIQIDVVGTAATLRVYNYTASATATFKLVYSCGGGSIDEVVDIRVGLGGKVYDTAGDAVRNQIMRAGFNDYVKQAFLNMLQHVAFTDNKGQQYYDDLVSTMFMDAGVDSISAEFEQDENVIWDTDSLDRLREYLTVTVYYEDLTSKETNAYLLSGTLEAGTSVITVSYAGATTTFNVTVTHNPVPEEYQRVEWIGAQRGSDDTQGQYIKTAVQFSGQGNVVVEGIAAVTEVLSNSGNLLASANKANAGQQGFSVAFGAAGTGIWAYTGFDYAWIEPNGASGSIINQFISFSATCNATTVSVTDGTKTNTKTGTSRNYSQTDIFIFAGNINGNAKYTASAKIKYLKVTENNVPLMELIPCYRKSDGEIGFYDLVTQSFRYNWGTGTFTKGADY